MKIVDINGKEREIQSIKRIIHDVPDALHTGELVRTEFVEVVIKGKMRSWVEWYPLEDFRKLNPTVMV